VRLGVDSESRRCGTDALRETGDKGGTIPLISESSTAFEFFVDSIVEAIVCGICGQKLFSGEDSRSI
jgi:hypothetical protein